MKKSCLYGTVLLLSIFSAATIVSITWRLGDKVPTAGTRLGTLVVETLISKKTILKDTLLAITRLNTTMSSYLPTQKLNTSHHTTIDMTNMVTTEAQKPISSYKREHFDTANLMQKMEELRPLNKFTLKPWKIKYAANSSLITLIVGVKSHPDNSEPRAAIRETWGSYNSFKGFEMKIFFTVGNAKDNKSQITLLEENMAHGDILQIDMAEAYEDVGKKALASMQWVEENCPKNWYYASSDDDMLVNVFGIYEHINDTIEDPSILCGYSFRDNSKPIRPKHKNEVPKSVYDFDRYPTFCAGGFYTMPAMLSNAIFRMSRQHKYFYNDDVWITGLLRLAVIDAGEFACANITDKYCAIAKTDYGDALHIMKPGNRLSDWKGIKKRMDEKIGQL